MEIKQVRNFWIEAEIDGRNSKLSGGPRSKTGGFFLTVKQRDNGGISTPVKIYGFADDSGNLELQVVKNTTGEMFTINTKR